MAIPSGEIYLLKNIPLNPSYEHTIDFKDKNEQMNYFFKHIAFRFEDYSFIRKEREFLRVELPFASLDGVNYLIFKSEESDRFYYAFIVNRVYVDETTTDIYFLIDVMQTFQFDYEWKASYIKQAHIDRWTADHKPIYSKTDEGLDYGTEYSVESAFALRQSEDVRWFLVTMKDYTKIISEGSAIMFPKMFPTGAPFSYLLLPSHYKMDPVFQAVVGNEEIIVTDMSDFSNVMMNSELGNYVHSINLLPYNPFVASINEGPTGTFTINFGGDAWIGTVGILNKLKCITIDRATTVNWRGILARAEWDIGLENTLPTAEQWEEIKKNPYTTKRDKRFESKLLCGPYRYNLLTDWKNDPVIFKNEYMTTDKITVNYAFAVTPNAPTRYWMSDYKKDPEGRYTSLCCPLSTEMPIISDAYYTYMLENKNTIQANLTNATISAGASAISGAISGGGIGGIGGAVFGGVTGAIGGALNIQSMVRSENAKQADLRAKPDTVISSKDSVFNLMDKNTEVTFYRMRICCENEEILAEIFNMSGYKVNRLEIPNTRSRTRFNYLQTMGANITGTINQADLLKIKEIYDKGITIWHYNEKSFNMLDYTYENIEVNLI